MLNSRDRDPIYFYLMGTTSPGRRLLKVGVTWHLELRRRKLQSSKRRKMSLLISHRLETYKALALEKFILQQNAEFRVRPRGDWLHWTDPLIAERIKILSKSWIDTDGRPEWPA